MEHSSEMKRISDIFDIKQRIKEYLKYLLRAKHSDVPSICQAIASCYRVVGNVDLDKANIYDSIAKSYNK